MLRRWLAVLILLPAIAFCGIAHAGSGLAQEKRWTEARQLLAQGKAAEAKEQLNELTRDYPKESDVYLFLGIAWLRLRDPQAAITAIQHAIELNPNHVEARTLLGWIDTEIRGDFDAAIKEYQTVVELRPASAEAYNNLGVAEKRKGDLDRAADAFNEALQRKPDYNPALTNRGWIFAERNQWPEARRDFEQALKINPADDGALYGFSQALRAEHDYAGAQQTMQRLISRSPNFIYWLEWGRIGLIRCWWVLLLAALAFVLKGRFTAIHRPPASVDAGGKP